MTLKELHDKMHEILSEPALLEAVNDLLAQYKHQSITYGELRSGLHLHLLCHALDKEQKVYLEVNGVEYLARSVRRRVDKIGRVDTSIVLSND